MSSTIKMLLAACSATLFNSVVAKIAVNPDTRQLVDDAGRAVVFHGVNVVYKVAPYIPSQGEFEPQLSLNDEDIENLKSWGMNFVRLGVMWEAVERTAGEFDIDYLHKVDALVTKLGEAGIYTLVDMHQDVFARSICGEGFPNFYAKEAIGNHPSCINRLVDHKLKPVFDKVHACYSMSELNYRTDEDGNPLIEDCQSKFFAAYYASKESIVAFQALYDNKDGLQDKFIDYWSITADVLAANPYVVGFDPLNEPFLGNPLKNPKYAKPGNQDKMALAPMYERIYKEAYHAADPTSIMWFEPNQAPDTVGVGKGLIFPIGFEVPPGGSIGSPYHVLNDHTYCCAAGATKCANGEPSYEIADFCEDYHVRKLAKRDEDAKRLGVPLFISEFGACLTDKNCTPEINAVGDAADKYIAGWAYWQFKNYADLTTSAGTGSEGFYEEDGSLQNWKVKALARTYLMFTQGVPTSFNFNTLDGVFTAAITVDTTIEEPTVMYTSDEYWYPNGKEVELSVNGTRLSQEQALIDGTDPRFFNFTVTDKSLHGKTIDIRCVPKLLESNAYLQ